MSSLCGLIRRVVPPASDATSSLEGVFFLYLSSELVTPVPSGFGGITDIRPAI